jgi:ABC-type nitrate/sulfonate/bicarbonate transport system ATPase subunit
MIELKNITKIYSDEYGSKINLFGDLSFAIIGSKITSVIAPVGSGKSSLLKIISGLERETSGQIIKQKEGKVILIPSEPSSFPWLSVKENILFGTGKTAQVNIDELTNLVGLEGYEYHYPNNRSIGFRFRISLARSLANNPICICLDEPFNKMDDETKIEIYQLVRRINEITGITILLATTNISEAIFLSDKLYLMSKDPGRIFSTLEIEFQILRNSFLFNSNIFISYREQIESLFIGLDSQKLLHISI